MSLSPVVEERQCELSIVSVASLTIREVEPGPTQVSQICEGDGGTTHQNLKRDESIIHSERSRASRCMLLSIRICPASCSHSSRH